jgi:hypothetical protein
MIRVSPQIQQRNQNILEESWQTWTSCKIFNDTYKSKAGKMELSNTEMSKKKFRGLSP